MTHGHRQQPASLTAWPARRWLAAAGALNIWAPVQPILGLVSVALLGWALRTRLAAERACPLPTT